MGRLDVGIIAHGEGEYAIGAELGAVLGLALHPDAYLMGAWLRKRPVGVGVGIEVYPEVLVALLRGGPQELWRFKAAVL